MDAARRFADEVRDLWFEPDRGSTVSCGGCAAIPHLYEPVLLDRLDAGTRLLTEHHRAFDPDDPAWQRWITLLTAWHCCHEAITQEELPDPMPVAQGATRGLRRIELRPESILGKAKQ